MMITAFRDPADDEPLPRRVPGAAKNVLDLFASLATVSSMPARTPALAGGRILRPDQADAVHQAARAILAEATPKEATTSPLENQ
jgi:hypothetical protein